MKKLSKDIIEDKPITINIYFKSPEWMKERRGGITFGFCQQTTDRTFDVCIDWNMSTIEKVGTLFHELTHCVVGLFVKEIGRTHNAEESFASGMDLYGKALFSWFLNKELEI